MSVSQSPEQPISRAHALFADEGLPFPPVPAGLEARMLQLDKHIFATERLTARPYDLYQCAEQFRRAPAEASFALFGFDGHGVNSWAVHYFVVQPGLALFLQLPWGGIYMNGDTNRSAIENAFQWAADLQKKVADAMAAAAIRDRRLIVVSSAFGGSSYTYASCSEDSSPAKWTEIQSIREDVDAALATIFTEGLTS